MVEAVGFPEFDQLLPVLRDAIFRKTEASHEPPVAQTATLQELERGLHHAELITIEGRLLNRAMRHTGPLTPDPYPDQIALTIQTSNVIFTAECPVTESAATVESIPLGSTVELTGVCMLHIRMGGTLESGDVGTMESFQLFLPGANSIRLLQKPSWLTPKRLLLGLALLSGILIVAVIWSVTVSRKNAALKIVVREKVKAQDELQAAHDELDDRVKERTAQLKFEMNERKEAEVRFKATLAERTRLAQELHDTTEQSLTGISLQLDTAAKLFAKGDDRASRPLDVARNLMTRSQLELRRSIWDLRSRELEQFDLPNALRMSAQEILEGTTIEMDLEITGAIHPLAEVVEQNLLRIGREALTNIVKHARARRVSIRLKFGRQTVTLQVEDDGCGFSPANVPGSEEGHFGLLGMSERAKRFNGSFRVVTSPESGTRLEVEIPLRESNEPDPTATDARAMI
jgi:signal transduction histidine kinase